MVNRIGSNQPTGYVPPSPGKVGGNTAKGSESATSSLAKTQSAPNTLPRISLRGETRSLRSPNTGKTSLAKISSGNGQTGRGSKAQQSQKSQKSSQSRQTPARSGLNSPAQKGAASRLAKLGGLFTGGKPKVLGAKGDAMRTGGAKAKLDNLKPSDETKKLASKAAHTAMHGLVAAGGLILSVALAAGEEIVEAIFDGI